MTATTSSSRTTSCSASAWTRARTAGPIGVRTSARTRTSSGPSPATSTSASASARDAPYSGAQPEDPDPGGLMSTISRDPITEPSHPFAAAISRRDHAALVETLASDVVLHSAVTSAPFEGRETVADIYAGVIDSFDHVEVMDEFADGETHAFFWRGR